MILIKSVIKVEVLIPLKTCRPMFLYEVVVKAGSILKLMFSECHVWKLKEFEIWREFNRNFKNVAVKLYFDNFVKFQLYPWPNYTIYDIILYIKGYGIRCDRIWYAAVWNDTIWYVIRCDAVRYGIIILVCCVTVWHIMKWYMKLHDYDYMWLYVMIICDTVRYNTIYDIYFLQAFKLNILL